MDKYISMGLGREAVSFAVLNYGDNPAKACFFSYLSCDLSLPSFNISSRTKTIALITQKGFQRSTR